jgi:hypothetical protein
LRVAIVHKKLRVLVAREHLDGKNVRHISKSPIS